MNKKIFIGFLFLISLLALSGGCGSSSNGPITSETNVNLTWNGAWVSSSSGTAEVATTNNSDESLSELTEAFGEITEDMLETSEDKALYEEYKKQDASEPAKIKASVTNTMLIFEDCDISKDKGTAKMTAVFIFSSDDVSYVPMLFNGVTLTTTRSQINAWTAEYSSGDTSISMDISMPSAEEMRASVNIQYADYIGSLDIAVNKNSQASSIKLAEILDGTWRFESGTQGGGYLASDSDSDISVLVPEDFIAAFNGTKEENSEITSSIQIATRMAVKKQNSADDDAVIQFINPSSSATITKINGDLYKLEGERGTVSFLYIDNTDEMYLFHAETEDNSEQSYVYLPLKKISFDIEAAMKKTWTAVDGGGYMHLDDPETFFGAKDDPLMQAVAEFLQDISFELKSSTLSFSDVTSDDSTITATTNFDASFTPSAMGTEFEDFVFPTLNEQVNFTRVGNILRYAEDDDNDLCISFISDTKALLSIATKKEGTGEAYFTLEFSAN